MATSKRHAFSLVELSIVLVILGLLTGGILTGQSLIRAAELRSVITDFTRYQTAVRSFRDKYFALPGDMRNATAFWGAQAGGAGEGYNATCAGLTHTSPATGTVTCNGDGDGMVGTNGATVERYERFRFWQQLANAGLVEGSYTGVTGPSSTFHAIPGQNVPKSRVGNTGFDIRHYDASGSDAVFSWGQSKNGNYFLYGAPLDGDSVMSSALTPEEAWNVDTKLDDSKPGMGKLYASATTTCATTTTANTALYNLTNSSVACRFAMFAD
tara:strand:+ start:2770 stop:3576 length:807 start_codon:yes stop_codon:yes gene_type:complete